MSLSASQQQKILEIRRRKNQDSDVLTRAQLDKIQQIERSRGLGRKPEVGPFLPIEIAKQRGTGKEAVAPPARKVFEEVDIERAPPEKEGLIEGPLLPKEQAEIRDITPGPLEDILGRRREAPERPMAMPEGEAEEEVGIVETAKQIPTFVARTVAQPFEFLRDVSAEAGKKLGEFLPERFKIDRESSLGKVLSVMTPEGGEPIRLPFQKEPLVREPRQFESLRDFAGEGLEAITNVVTAGLPVARGTKVLTRVGVGSGIGASFGTASALKDEDVKTVQDGVGRIVVSSLVGGLLPELPRLVKNFGGGVIGKTSDILNRFTNKKTGEALKVLRKTSPEIIKKYGRVTNPYTLRKNTFNALYENALKKEKGAVSSNAIKKLAKNFIDIEPEGRLGKIARKIAEKKGNWEVKELHNMTLKLKNLLPKSKGSWVGDHSFANGLVRSIRQEISKKSPTYGKVNADWGKVSEFISANKIIDESGSGVVGLGLSSLLGSNVAGPAGAVLGPVVKSAKAQRAVIDAIKALEGAKTNIAATKVIDGMIKAAPDRETINALVRLGVLLGIREIEID